jgi:DNA invertase Pin-like site-specific DNA recombinase
MFAKMRLLFAEFERELIGERAANHAHHKRRTGRAYAGRSAPYGWDRNGDAMVPNVDEQTVVAELRARRDAGEPLNAVARDLNGRGVSGKLGGRWQANTVYRVLAIADAIEGGGETP